jgi:acyl-CoA thioester hydrolase
MDINQYKFRTPIQLRFVDIDKLGHVNNATFLSYFETARVNYFDKIFDKAINWNKTGFILAKSIIEYKEPVFLEDEIVAYTSVVRLGNKSFDISNVLVKVKNGIETVCTSATGILVCINYSNMQTVEMPEEWRKKIIDFEGANLIG